MAEKLKSAILHEDDDVLILNKPAGMPVQGGGRNSVSLDQVLKRHFVWRGQFPRQGAGLALVCGMCHRDNASLNRTRSSLVHAPGNAGNRTAQLHASMPQRLT